MPSLTLENSHKFQVLFSLKSNFSASSATLLLCTWSTLFEAAYFFLAYYCYYVFILAIPSGYENAFQMGETQALGNGVYTATMSQIQTVTKNNLAGTGGVVRVFVEVFTYKCV